MALRQYSLVWFLSTLIVALTGDSASGFIILPAPNAAEIHYNKEEEYTFGANGIGTTILSSSILTNPPSLFDRPGYLTPLPRGGTFLFKQVLRSYFPEPNWIFREAENDLLGSFYIYNHFACGVQTDCGGYESGLPIRRGGVGALLDLEYRPRRSDPKPVGGKGPGQLHWIQWVIASYGDKRFPGFIDNGERTEDPYYDTPGYPFAGEDFFQDRPYTNSPIEVSNPNYFSAELYLVRELTDPSSEQRIVEIYNGVRWGWKNRIKGLLQRFFDSLSSGTEVDKFRLDGLTPGTKFHAWINNDLPSNRCNPNTYLSAYNNSEYWYDNDSSPVGDGFASSLTGIVSSDGIINLTVQAANGGRRGEDKGSYELYVELYDEDEGEPLPPEIIVGSSGGGGVSRPRPGNTQQNPILPNRTDSNWQIFSNVPGCRWYDPHTPYGFEFQALEDTLFTEILDFPVGLDNRFKVSVGNTYLGEFGPGDSVDFVSLLGQAVDNFKITGIDSLVGDTEETAFPIQLAFNKQVGSFKMRPFHEDETPTPKHVPEPVPGLGLLILGIYGIFQALKIRKDSQQ